MCMVRRRNWVSIEVVDAATLKVFESDWMRL